MTMAMCDVCNVFYVWCDVVNVACCYVVLRVGWSGGGGGVCLCVLF